MTRALLISAILALGLTACGQKPAPAPQAPATPAPAATPAPEAAPAAAPEAAKDAAVDAAKGGEMAKDAVKK